MKKLPLLISVLFISTLASASTIEQKVCFKNKKNVTILEHDYNKLINVGYTHKEIQSISKAELSKVKAMNIISTSQSIYSIDYEDNRDNSTYSIGPDINIEDHYGNGGTSPLTSSAEKATSTKRITITGTYYKNLGYDCEFFVKVNFDWLEEPDDRLLDIIMINFSDNLQIKKKVIDGNDVIDFDAKMTYDHYYKRMRYSILPGANDQDISGNESCEVIFNGEDDTSFLYSIDKAICVPFTLPKDFNHYYNEGSFTSYYEDKYTNFSLSLSATFVSKYTSINAVTFAGSLQHQIKTNEIDWDNVTTSSSYPYFEYAIELSNTEIFEDSFSKEIFFENLNS